MSQEINSYSQILSLDYDVRLSSSSSFNAQEAFENAFEDVLSEKISENSVKNASSNPIIKNLGAPPGFWLEDGTSSTSINIFNNYAL